MKRPCYLYIYMFGSNGLYDKIYDPLALSTYGEDLDYEQISAVARAELPNALKKYNKIIDRLGIREHLK